MCKAANESRLIFVARYAIVFTNIKPSCLRQIIGNRGIQLHLSLLEAMKMSTHGARRRLFDHATDREVQLGMG